MAKVNGKLMFPCPVCMRAREVRPTKNGKPYLICDACGVQVFVRGAAGIEEFHRLLQHNYPKSIRERQREMECRYRLTCSQCGHEFWAEPSLVKTSVFDGGLKGFQCPKSDCEAVVPWERTQ